MDPVGSIPFHVAQAYGIRRVAPVVPVRSAPVRSIPQTGRTDAGAIPLFHPDGGTKANPQTARLIAAQVPGSIDFSGDQPAPARDALPLYRHPADRNAAATGVSQGRLLDLNG